MRWTELRGVVALALVIAAIVFAWTQIENRPIDDDTSTATTTSTSTTTTAAPTTTLGQDDANLLICERARSFVDEVAALPDGGPGPLAELAFGFWRDVLDLSAGEARAEIVAVVNYYEDYIQTAGPFGYDTARIIVEGDKEKLEQLITRPAPGFEGSRGLISFACGVTLPDQPRMDADDFQDLEDRLLDDD